MIIVTGAVGFIGSKMIAKLNNEGYNDIIAVDDFSNPIKNENIKGLIISKQVDRNEFHNWLKENQLMTQIIIHLGARTDTTEFDKEVFNWLNLDYTKDLFILAGEYGIPVIYASSAATYGAGEHGYSDNHEVIPHLKPLNPYGESKNDLDKWLLYRFDNPPYFWAGLKFFNVYGENEDHKGRMASVIWHAYHQIAKTGRMKLFKSHKPEYTDGGQMRDFIYVNDVVNVVYWLMNNRIIANRGIYNLGSGCAETFLSLTQAVFQAMGKTESIEFIDTPADIREAYQYYTKAEMSKLKNIGYPNDFTSLTEGVKQYVQNYLIPKYPLT
ncbi:MAG: ADP-glyceromanno-heptose 6-epimerase [Bacteroidota bacterium]|nr:ADP-glyceromanno-heptose 6-epimerase [Bacteroidota bacterium]